MNKIGGADESLMGSLRQGGPERLTGAEFQGTRSSAISRVERLARVISMQSMQDLGYMMAEHTQQLMTEETYVDITGRHQEDLSQVFGNGKKAKVSPFDLMINYDVMVSDGSLPNGSMDSWTQVYKLLVENPGVGQRFDMVRIFEYIATLGGAKNVGDFKIQTKVMSDEQVMNQAQQGNIMPLENNFA
jgi:hypothetical protein